MWIKSFFLGISFLLAITANSQTKKDSTIKTIKFVNHSVMYFKKDSVSAKSNKKVPGSEIPDQENIIKYTLPNDSLKKSKVEKGFLFKPQK